MPVGERYEDEMRKALDDFLQRRILGVYLGVAHYWIWFATDFLADVQKLPEDTGSPVKRGIGGIFDTRKGNFRYNISSYIIIYHSAIIIYHVVSSTIS